MMHRRMWSAVGAGLWAAAGWCALAQGVDTVYALHGRVVDALTRQPIARALVTSGDRRLATMTDHNGNFVLDVSIPGAVDAATGVTSDAVAREGFARASGVGLMARRPGYLQRGEQRQVLLNKPSTESDIVLELTPAASVSGTVMGEGSSGAAKVRVTLLEYQVQEGAPAWTQRASAQTNEEGRFHFGDLEPGEYTVLSNEWAGDDPSYTQVSRQFPPRYLGDVRTLAAATRLDLRAGGGEQVALHLRPATYYPVKVPVQGLPPNAQVQVRVAAQSSEMGYSLGWNMRDRAVEGALPGGEYTLTLESFGPQRSSARVPLVVGSTAVEHAPVALAVEGSIPVRVHLELTGKGDSAPGGSVFVGNGETMPTEANPVQLHMRSTDRLGGGGGNMRRGQGPDGVLENVGPGTYRVEATTIRGYIASMTSGGADLMRRPLVLGDGGSADPIDVVVRDDGASVTGEVDFSGKEGAVFCAVVLVSADGGQMRQGFSQAGSTFNIGNIAPGTYRAFALDMSDVQRLPYRDATAMRAYDALGTAVTVSANEHTTVKLQLTPLERAGTKE